MTIKKLEINPKTRGLIFDLDGTIADTMPRHYIAWRNACAKYGIDFPPGLFSELAGVPVYPTVEKLNKLFGKNIDPQEMGDNKEAEFLSTLHETKPIQPVVDLIKKYYGKLPMSVGTGSQRYIAEQTLDVLGLNEYFNILVSCDDIKNHKPHPETFLYCARQMGVEPEYCQVFEDGKPGLQAAETAGMIVTDVTACYTVTIGKTIN